MIPSVLSEEVACLIQTGFSITIEESGNKIYIVFKDFQLPQGLYNIDKTDLMIWTADSYPKSNFDMFWVDQSLLLKNNGIPHAGQSIEHHIGRTWRRFSIHPYQVKPWNPFEDNISSYLTYINQRLNTGL